MGEERIRIESYNMNEGTYKKTHNQTFNECSLS